MADVGPYPPHRFSLATLRQGPFISAATHTVLTLGQRPLPGLHVPACLIAQDGDEDRDGQGLNAKAYSSDWKEYDCHLTCTEHFGMTQLPVFNAFHCHAMPEPPVEGTSADDEFAEASNPQSSAPSKAGSLSATAGGGVRKSGKTRASAPLKKGRASMTLRELIEANVIQPGRNKISVVYKGTNHQASLNKDGLIIYQGKRFQSATSFSIHCKRLQTPNKQGDDGWKSTLYEGQPLETYRKKYLARIQGSKEGDSDGESGGADGAAAGKGAEEAAAPAAEGTDQWVQCDRCRTWRIVPDEHWPGVEADDRDVWYCEYANWDVTQLTPYTPSCVRMSGGE